MRSLSSFRILLVGTPNGPQGFLQLCNTFKDLDLDAGAGVFSEEAGHTSTEDGDFRRHRGNIRCQCGAGALARESVHTRLIKFKRYMVCVRRNLLLKVTPTNQELRKPAAIFPSSRGRGRPRHTESCDNEIFFRTRMSDPDSLRHLALARQLPL